MIFWWVGGEKTEALTENAWIQATQWACISSLNNIRNRGRQKGTQLCQKIQSFVGTNISPKIFVNDAYKYSSNLMVSTEASWWNILNLKIHTTLGYIVSLILWNLGQVFCFRIVSRITYGWRSFLNIFIFLFFWSSKKYSSKSSVHCYYTSVEVSTLGDQFAPRNIFFNCATLRHLFKSSVHSNHTSTSIQIVASVCVWT